MVASDDPTSKRKCSTLPRCSGEPGNSLCVHVACCLTAKSAPKMSGARLPSSFFLRCAVLSAQAFYFVLISDFSYALSR